MDRKEKEQHLVKPLLNPNPEIGRWLWALEDSRRRTLREIRQCPPGMLDWQPEAAESSMGTILYHLAGIEADWLYAEVLERPYPAHVIALFPYEIRDGQGHLHPVRDLDLQEHLHRLETVRGLLLGVYTRMELTDFRRARSLPRYDVTPEWVLHHLMQHEAEHRGQLGTLRARYTGR